MAHVTKTRTIKNPVPIRVGQVWQRFDGTRFTIERIERGQAVYWLSKGSKPQYRSISLENLQKRYRRITA
jgi:hypothetical protein